MTSRILSGNEAIVEGALAAGVKVARLPSEIVGFLR
jgi:hypothetical protein